MKTIDEINLLLRQHRKELAQKYNISELGIFGSVVRNEQKATSDVDILIDFFDPPSLFGFIELEAKLSALLDCKVDLVMKSSLKPAIGKHILRETQYVRKILLDSKF